jgi:RNA polymerase sigma factor (sigma-70 family)
MPWLTEDRERLARFREGGRQMLGELFRMYAPGLARQLAGGLRLDERLGLRFRGGASPSETDDVVQETFIRAFNPRARAQYDGLRPFSGYLLGIARNVLSDWHRTDARRARLFEAETPPDDPLVPATHTTEHAFAAKQIDGIIRVFMQSLTATDRVLVRLRLFAGGTRREVSERTGYSAMRVRLREIALRRQLLERLRAAGVITDDAGTLCDRESGRAKS